VSVGVDPAERSAIVTAPDGRTSLDPLFEAGVRAGLERSRLAGYDLRVRAPRFVPLELALDVCVARGHFRADVGQAAADALRALFDAANFTFGQSVYLSRIYAAVERVEGVDSAVVSRFRRFGRTDNGELETGVLPLARWEIAQLDDDPSFPEHGTLVVRTLGGKG
jgi:hypothetical protein